MSKVVFQTTNRCLHPHRPRLSSLACYLIHSFLCVASPRFPPPFSEPYECSLLSCQSNSPTNLSHHSRHPAQANNCHTHLVHYHCKSNSSLSPSHSQTAQRRCTPRSQNRTQKEKVPKRSANHRNHQLAYHNSSLCFGGR
ncbi:hypothetical protein N431DRAFT_94937 [Stipitochalara longipes BDJ]|nr:hypothetical protein N431DRAFT_94937 [Stipitochalara longipes BDJ]